jgi:hypothetical protein
MKQEGKRETKACFFQQQSLLRALHVVHLNLFHHHLLQENVSLLFSPSFSISIAPAAPGPGTQQAKPWQHTCTQVHACFLKHLLKHAKRDQVHVFFVNLERGHF